MPIFVFISIVLPATVYNLVPSVSILRRPGIVQTYPSHGSVPTLRNRWPEEREPASANASLRITCPKVFSLLTGLNRFGLFGVSFVVSWICTSVPFCAPTCMFYPKGKLHTKKNRAHDRPLRIDSNDLMAEREGFEPPIALRLCLISSQVHSTGLCHLSAW